MRALPRNSLLSRKRLPRRTSFQLVAVIATLAVVGAPAAAPAALAAAPTFALRVSGPSGNGDARPLTPGDAAPLLDGALALWGLNALPAGTSVRISDVPGDALAITQGGTITLDATAAGHGWFVDPTPADSSEFGIVDGTLARAADDSDAAAGIDLKTVLAHEIGHLLGRADLDRDDSVMHESLAVGIRHLSVGADEGRSADVVRALAAGSALPMRATDVVTPEDPAPADPAPAVSDPPVADPPTADPPAADPPAADPPATDPAPAADDAVPAEPAPAEGTSLPDESIVDAPPAAEAAADTEADASPSVWVISISGSAVLSLDGGDLVIDGVRRSLSSLSGIVIVGSAGSDRLTIDADALAALAGMPVSFDGAGGDDVLVGPAVDARWVIDGDGSGRLLAAGGALAFAGIEKLQGADGNQDVFAIQGAGSIAAVDGGVGGFDTLVSSSTTSVTDARVTGPQSGVVVRDGLATAYEGLEPVDTTCSNLCAVDASSTSVSHDIRISSTGATNLTIAFFAGTAESHTFTIGTGPVTLTVRGGTAADIFRVGILPSNVTLVIDGSGGNDTLAGPDLDSDWILTGTNAGATSFARFSNVENLRGGAGGDVFGVRLPSETPQPAFTVAGTIDGGLGSDSLVATNLDNAWSITAPDAGTLNAQAFAGMENLIGGHADDTFTVMPGGSISGLIDGGAEDDAAAVPPVDTISFAGYGSPVVLTLAGGALSFAALFSLVTSNTDPGAGKIGLDTAVQNVATKIRVDASDSTGAPLIAAIDRIVDTTGSLGQVRIFSNDDPAKWLLFQLIGIDSSNPGYRTLSVSFMEGGASPFAGGDALTFLYIPALHSATGVESFVNIDMVHGSAGATDAVRGPPDEVTRWTIDGIDSGSVAGIGFDSFETLVGADESADVFSVATGATITGSIQAGSGSGDALVFVVSDTQSVLYNSIDATGSGTAAYSSWSIVYSGLDLQTVLGGTPGKRIISGSTANDTIIVSAASPDTMQVKFVGLAFLENGQLKDTWTFVTPTESLVIEGLEGTDSITVQSLSSNWDGASLAIYGNRRQSSETPVFVDGSSPDPDEVFFSGSISTGATIEAYAAFITVKAGMVIDAGAGWITLRVRQIGNATFQNLSPVYATDRAVEITIETTAELRATGIYLIAQAEDRSLAEYLGATREVNNFVIAPLTGLVEGLAALPVKLLLKNSSSKITIGNGAKLIGDDTVGIYATAAAEASGKARGSLISVGFARATATAEVFIGTDVVITSTAAIVVTSTATATASIESSTERSLESLPSPGGAEVAISIAVSDAVAKSHITVGDRTLIQAGKTANIVATGNISSSAAAESGLHPDGSAGLAFSIELSDADITTTVNGTVRANQIPGSVVKIEIDPTEIDPTKLGYVDYANDRIHVGLHALVTEDVITYTTRRGTSIGGLVDGRQYFVIALADNPDTADINEAEWIKLAETEQQAVVAGLGDAYHAGNVVNLVQLSGPLATSNNKREFDSVDVDAAGNSIRLPWAPDSFNTFELGQAVVYHKGNGNIVGLEDGLTYYVIASTSQTNLQGNTRFSDGQVIQLAETENEARAGVFIDFGAATGTDMRFEAKHVLDSGFATGVGIIAQLTATDSSSASAGIAPEEEVNPWGKFLEVIDTNAADKITTSLYQLYNANQAKAGAGASSGLSGAGALAFTQAHHNVVTLVGSDAVLQSNEDLEVKALTTQTVTGNAESSIEAPTDGLGQITGGSSAALSVAVSVIVIDNTSSTTIKNGATLDGQRATRVISDVTYPFLTRFDQYIPLSWGEFVDSLRQDGPDAVLKYLNGTLGLKDSLFNTWTSATAEADKVGIAGSVTVFVLTNVSEAIVEGGVDINQDFSWSDNPGGYDGEQVVSVEATNYQQFINMTGIFSLPGLNLTAKDTRFKDRISTPGASQGGSTAGAGGSFYIFVQDNTTHAIVGDGARIFSGADGRFNMKAEEAIFHIDLVQSGTAGGQFAIAGSVAYIGQTSDTLVQLSNLAFVTGRDIRLYAGDLMTQVTWVGGITLGHGVGVGVSIAINDLDRTTKAVIGTTAPQSASGVAARATTNFDVTEAIDVLAKLDGDLWAFSVAGAVSSPDTTPAPPANTPSAALKVLGVAPAIPTTGVGLAGAASVNIVHDTVQASLTDAGAIRAGQITIAALDDFFQLAVTGSASFVVSAEPGGGAASGAFSFNDLEVDTRAFIDATDIVKWTKGGVVLLTDDVIVTATRTGDLVAIAAGIAASVGEETRAGAGSFAANVILNVTEASIRGMVGTIGGDLIVAASDSTRIISIGGGAALGGSLGIGLGVALNLLGTEARPTITRASITASTLTIGGTVLDVTATNVNPLTGQRIYALGAGIGIAPEPDAIGLGFILAVNIIHNLTDAHIASSTIVEPIGTPGALNTRVIASDDSGIVSISGAVAASSGSAGAAALAYNEIAADVLATLDDVDLTSNGSLTVQATTTGEIGGVAVGVAASLAEGVLAGAGSLLINIISGRVAASIVDSNTTSPVGSSVITVGGTVTVSASDTSVIASAAGGVGVGVSTAAVGAAISYNLITHAIDAVIDGPSVVANGATSDIIVSASSTATLVALAVGVALSLNNLAIGGSLTVNSIANTLRALIMNSPDVRAGRDVVVAATESITLVAIAGGVGASASIVAAGMAFAYNFIGGSFDPANPDKVNSDTAAGGGSDQIVAAIDNARVTAGRNISVTAGYRLPAGPPPTAVSVGGIAVLGDSFDAIQLAIPGDPSGTGGTAYTSAIVSVTVGAAIGLELVIGGSASINVIKHAIVARITGSRAVEADGTILVAAADDLTAVAIAGGIAVGDTAAGAAVPLQIDISTVQAFIGDGVVIDARGNGQTVSAPTADASGNRVTIPVRGLAVTATSFQTIRTIAIGLAGGFDTGLAGSGSVTILTRTVQAWIGDGAKVNQGTTAESTAQNVLVLAASRTDHVGLAGSVAIAGEIAGGAGLDVGVITKTTEAWIGSGAQVQAQGDVFVLAYSWEHVVSVSIAAAGGATAGIAGAVGVYVITVTTRAQIRGTDTAAVTPTRVLAEGSVFVWASTGMEVDVLAGNAAVSGAAGLGGALVVPVITKTTDAAIGARAVVDGRGNRPGIAVFGGFSYAVLVPGGENQVSAPTITPDDYGSDPHVQSALVDPQLTKRDVVTPGTVTGFTGVAVVATSTDDIGVFGIGVAGSAAVAIQLSGAVHVMTSSTTASIGDAAQVNTSAGLEGSAQDVMVVAQSDYRLLAIVGGVAIGETVAGTPGVAVAVVVTDVTASIGASAQVQAQRDIQVRAGGSEDVLIVAIAIAGSLEVAVAGAVGVLVIDSATHASIGAGAVVAAGGNVLVLANDSTDVDIVSLGAGIGLGAAGVGAGVAVTVITKDTRAWIGNATVDALGGSAPVAMYDGSLSDGGVFGTVADARGIIVFARSDENVLSIAIAGAGGLGAGIAGAVTVEVVDADTRAYIDGGARINTISQASASANQDVRVAAVDTLKVVAVAGAVGVGAVGLAGGVDVGVMHNDTTAFIAGSDVNARRHVTVSALSDHVIESYAISAGFGIAGVGAAVSVWTLGGNLLTQYQYADKKGDGTPTTQGADALTGKGSNGTSNTSTIAQVDALIRGSGASGALGATANPGPAAGSSQNSNAARNAAGSARSSFDGATPDAGLSGATAQPERASSSATRPSPPA